MDKIAIFLDKLLMELYNFYTTMGSDRNGILLWQKHKFHR